MAQFVAANSSEGHLIAFNCLAILILILSVKLTVLHFNINQIKKINLKY